MDCRLRGNDKRRRCPENTIPSPLEGEVRVGGDFGRDIELVAPPFLTFPLKGGRDKKRGGEEQ